MDHSFIPGRSGPRSFKQVFILFLFLMLVIMVLGGSAVLSPSTDQTTSLSVNGISRGNVTLTGLTHGETLEDDITLDIIDDDPDNITRVAYVVDGEQVHEALTFPYTYQQQLGALTSKSTSKVITGLAVSISSCSHLNFFFI
jgi:hypothetical protein